MLPKTCFTAPWLLTEAEPKATGNLRYKVKLPDQQCLPLEALYRRQKVMLNTSAQLQQVTYSHCASADRRSRLDFEYGKPHQGTCLQYTQRHTLLLIFRSKADLYLQVFFLYVLENGFPTLYNKEKEKDVTEQKLDDFAMCDLPRQDSEIFIKIMLN